ncbi:hypothetical protein VNO77_19123 [Canavalia gladiata]|uniref:Secreted protein n=1 Tax=Canavalia gladiata TaxID=3824 RepID=A0AAN9QL31_CANGL
MGWQQRDRLLLSWVLDMRLFIPLLLTHGRVCSIPTSVCLPASSSVSKSYDFGRRNVEKMEKHAYDDSFRDRPCVRSKMRKTVTQVYVEIMVMHCSPQQLDRLHLGKASSVWQVVYLRFRQNREYPRTRPSRAGNQGEPFKPMEPGEPFEPTDKPRARAVGKGRKLVVPLYGGEYNLCRMRRGMPLPDSSFYCL